MTKVNWVTSRIQHKKDLEAYVKTLDYYVVDDIRDLAIVDNKPVNKWVSFLKKLGYHLAVTEVIAWAPITPPPFGNCLAIPYAALAITHTVANINGGPEKLVLIGNYLRKADSIKDKSMNSYYRGI